MSTMTDIQEKGYTAEDYLFGCVNFPVPEEAVRFILAGREVSGSVPFSEIDKREADLLKADLYVWICTSPNRRGDISDSDNSWRHTEGGYTLSEADKNRLMALATGIYEQYDEPLPFKKGKIKVVSHGIRRCNYDLSGKPLPRILW